MDIALVISLSAAAANLSMASLHLAMSRTPGWKASRVFSAIALTAATYNILSALLASEGYTDPFYIRIAHLAYLTASLHCTGWIIYAYSSGNGFLRPIPKRIRWVVASALISGVLFAVTGWGLQPQVRSISIAWAGATYHYPVTTLVGDLYGCTMPILLAIALIRLWRRFRAGERHLGLQLVAFGVFLLTVVDELLVADRVIAFLSLADLGFLCVVLPISFQSVRRITADARRLHHLTNSLQDEVATSHLALVESEERYRTLVETSPDGICMTGLDGVILVCNLRAAEMHGFASQKEVVGLSMSSMIVPEQRALAAEGWAETLEKGSFHRELLFLRRDGSSFPGELSAAVVRNAGDAVSGFMAVTRDVTDRKQAEADRALLEEQLRHAQKLESLGTLTGGVAHEFNNLLTIVTGYSDLLVQELRAGDPTRTYAEEILKAGNHGATLTMQLLAFSRRQVIQPKLLVLNDVVRDSTALLRRLVGEDIVVETHLGLALGPVLADPAQISHALMNLATNARDAMPGGGRLILETANVELNGKVEALPSNAIPGKWVRLTATDTGTGMEPHVRERIFEPFFTTKEPGKGTGLGLAMVYGSVRQNGGWIDVDSKVGSGTTFSIYLPRQHELGPIELRSEEPVPGSAVSGTVLLVEDEDGVRRFAAGVLASHGYHVISACDGPEAVQLAESQTAKIDLMITDAVMPRMNGNELAHRMATLRPGMKLLYISGYSEDVVAKRGALHDGTLFLPKPFTRAELLSKVREALGPAPATSGS